MNDRENENRLVYVCRRFKRRLLCNSVRWSGCGVFTPPRQLGGYTFQVDHPLTTTPCADVASATSISQSPLLEGMIEREKDRLSFRTIPEQRTFTSRLEDRQSPCRVWDR